MLWPWKPGYGSVKVIGNITIRYSAYDFLLTFSSNYGSISCRFWDIQYWKMLWPWNRGQYSLKVIENGIIRYIVYGFLLVFFSNFVLGWDKFAILDWNRLSWKRYGAGPWLLWITNRWPIDPRQFQRLSASWKAGYRGSNFSGRSP